MELNLKWFINKVISLFMKNLDTIIYISVGFSIVFIMDSILNLAQHTSSAILMLYISCYYALLQKH